MNTTDIKTRLYTSAHYNPFFMDGLEIDHIIFYRDGKEIASLNWFGTDNHYIVIYFPFEVKKAAKLNLNRQDAFYMRSKTDWKRCYNLYIHADLTDLKSLGREDYLSDWDRDGSREKFTITIHGERREWYLDKATGQRKCNTEKGDFVETFGANYQSVLTAEYRKCEKIAEKWKQLAYISVSSFDIHRLMKAYNISEKRQKK